MHIFNNSNGWEVKKKTRKVRPVGSRPSPVISCVAFHDNLYFEEAAVDEVVGFLPPDR